jgi:hypothetical protein
VRAQFRSRSESAGDPEQLATLGMEKKFAVDLVPSDLERVPVVVPGNAGTPVPAWIDVTVTAPSGLIPRARSISLWSLGETRLPYRAM